MALTFGEHINMAVTLLDNLLDDGEPESDALVIHVRRSK